MSQPDMKILIFSTLRFNEVWRKCWQKLIIPFLDDRNAQPSALNVLSAATTLALALQQCKTTPSPPDRDTAHVINAWLDSYMPVSFFFCAKIFFLWIISFTLRLSDFKQISNHFSKVFHRLIFELLLRWWEFF